MSADYMAMLSSKCCQRLSAVVTHQKMASIANVTLGIQACFPRKSHAVAVIEWLWTQLGTLEVAFPTLTPTSIRALTTYPFPTPSTIEVPNWHVYIFSN